jgi:hypothetical protein
MRTEKLRAREVPFSPNSNAIVIDENQERVERKRRKEGREAAHSFPYTRHGERRGIREK